MSNTGQLLTADTNFVAKGNFNLTAYTIANGVTPYIGSWGYLDSSGNFNPVPVNNGSTDNSALRVIGQVFQTGTALLTSLNEVVVRYNGCFEANVLSGQTPIAGDIVYLTDDNEITLTSTHNPKAGIYIGPSPAGNALVVQSIQIPS